MRKMIYMVFGIIFMSFFLTACGLFGSTESKIKGVWKLEEPDKDVIYLEFTKDNLVYRDLDDKTETLLYDITDLENKNFLLEGSKSEGGFKEILFEGSFEDKNTISILNNSDSRYRYDDGEVKMSKVKDFEKDMEEEAEKVDDEENEGPWEDLFGNEGEEEEEDDFSQGPSNEELEEEDDFSQGPSNEEENEEEEEDINQTYETDAEEYYADSCATCHGDDLTGDMGPAIDSIGSDLSAEEIEEVIIDGKGAMPSNILPEDEAKEVADWLSEME